MKSDAKAKVVHGAAAKAGAARTLRELGLDGGLAEGLELAFRLMGAVEGGRVVGYTFSTTDGQRHALRLERSGTNPEVARAA